MSGAKETLGFPSRTAAVMALRKQGLTTAEIGRRIGIEPKVVSALECSAAKWSSRADGAIAVRPAAVIGAISLNVRQLLRPHAARRGLSVDALVREIVDAVAHGQLVDEAERDGRGAAAAYRRYRGGRPPEASGDA